MAVIKKVAVANRGEIAKRILGVCREMGLQTVLLYSAGDRQNEAFRLADERICIGPSDPTESYLSIEKNINGALSSGAEALHPGYGFLSENSELARQCENKGLIFIGPPAGAISLLGNKISSKKLAEKVGVPTLPATGDSHSEEFFVQKAKEMSYPVLIKAVCGGGGRALSLVHNEKELKQALPLARLSALQNFGSEDVFLEKYLSQAKHIEVQFFVSADKEFFILGDRDCSLQRRRQKVIETAPSGLSQKIKREMEEACRALCLSLDYRSAGTVEFLVQDEKFYFMEINTRLQVEHTVTEMIYGVDLVRAQILTAMGQPAFWNNDMKPKGYSLQCRICAEDPHQNFLPSAGPLLFCQWPQGRAVRGDTAYQTGDLISALYDSLMAKIIVWDDSRVRAIEKMKKALEETIIFGVQTNIPFLNWLLSHEEFIADKAQTHSLESWHSSKWRAEALPFPKGFLQDFFKELEEHPIDNTKKISSFNPWSYFYKPNKS